MEQYNDAIQGLRNVVKEKNLTAGLGEMAAMATAILGLVDNRVYSPYEILGIIFEFHGQQFKALDNANKGRVPVTGYLPAREGLALISTFLTEELNK